MAEEQTGQRRTEEREESEAMARLQEEINNLPISEHLVFMLRSLSSLAIDRLGLAPESAARRDPTQARLGIEAFKAVLTVLEHERPAEEISAYRSMLSQLQMAYVGALGAGPAPVQPQPAEPDEAPKKTAEPRPVAKGGAKPATAAKARGSAKTATAAKAKGSSGTKKSS